MARLLASFFRSFCGVGSWARRSYSHLQPGDYRVEKVEDAVNIGDMVWVKITETDDKSRINLSRKNALSEVENK